MKRFNSIYIIYGVIIYFLSIYIIPFVLAFALVNFISKPLAMLQYEDIISILISLGSLFLIGLIMSRKNKVNFGDLLFMGVVILIVSLIGLIMEFSLFDLIHDVLIIPVVLAGHYLSKWISGNLKISI